MNKLESESIYCKLSKHYMKVVYVFASLFFIYIAAFGAVSDMVQRCALITLLCPTVFFRKPLSIGKDKKTYWWTRAIDLILLLTMIAGGVYVLITWPSKILRSNPSTHLDMIMGIIMISCVLIVTKRATGLLVAVTALVFLLYTYFGYLFDGILGHRGESLKRIITTMYVSTEGIFGSAVGVAASYIILFVVFGAFLEAFGTGQWFVDFSFSLSGKYRGGPAKTAILSSGLMGMISGASAANVVTTGSFTIPLMKRTGYKPHEAGAIEAVASTGGMIMPPIMGAGAFIMADFLQVPYSTIAASAAIPAFLFYFSLFLVADSIAVKRKLYGLPPNQLPKMKEVMKQRGIFVIPIILLILLIVLGYSTMLACVYSIGCILVVAFFKKETRPSLATVIDALYKGAENSTAIVCTCSAAGIIVCSLALTGLGTKVSTSLMTLAGGNIYVGALIAAIVAIILGCGMPPAAVYVILGSVLAPPLIQMGATPIAAHMFIFYFSCIGTITPPVAITAYAGAAIADASPNKTGWTAFRYGLVAYIIPFMFITSPALLLVAPIQEILIGSVTAIIGVICLVGAVEGFIFIRFSVVPRLLLFIAALCTLYPEKISDIVGLILIAIALILNRVLKQKRE